MQQWQSQPQVSGPLTGTDRPSVRWPRGLGKRCNRTPQPPARFSTNGVLGRFGFDDTGALTVVVFDDGELHLRSQSNELSRQPGGIPTAQIISCCRIWERPHEAHVGGLDPGLDGGLGHLGRTRLADQVSPYFLLDALGLLATQDGNVAEQGLFELPITGFHFPASSVALGQPPERKRRASVSEVSRVRTLPFADTHAYRAGAPVLTGPGPWPAPGATHACGRPSSLEPRRSHFKIGFGGDR